MTQEEINVLYNITIVIHEHEWFRKGKKRRDRNELQEWVSKELATTLNIYTIPCGMSWGVLCTKEDFEEYWNNHSKIK
jgi:hypothetical protein